MVQTLERLVKLFGILIIIAAILGIQIFIGIAILSMLIVPLTYLYCFIVKRSYNSVIDSSGILYKLNKLGQWSIVAAVGLTICWIFIFKIL